jgi:hypothetical protein
MAKELLTRITLLAGICLAAGCSTFVPSERSQAAAIKAAAEIAAQQNIRQKRILTNPKQPHIVIEVFDSKEKK